MDITNGDSARSSVIRIPVTVGCLPPPYSDTTESRPASSSHQSNSTRSGYYRSESTENIISQENNDIEQKICCSRISCQLCLTNFLQFKRIMLLLGIFTMACIITSVTLGVARIPESSYITLSLMFAGESFHATTVFENLNF